MQRLLQHEGSQDPEHQQADDSSSGSRDDRELGDRALTDEPSGSGCSRGPRGQMSMGRGHSQGPSGLGRLVGRPHSEECGDRSSSVLSSDRDRSGVPRDSERPEGPGGRGRSQGRYDPSCSASPDEILLQSRRQRRLLRHRASNPAPVTPPPPRVHTQG